MVLGQHWNGQADIFGDWVAWNTLGSGWQTAGGKGKLLVRRAAIKLDRNIVY